MVSKFTLMRCGVCDCGGTALAVHVEGEDVGWRLTYSTLGVWTAVESIQPGDPRYRECIEYLNGYLNSDFEPHREQARHYLDHLPAVDNLERLEKAWLMDWSTQPIGVLDWDKREVSRRLDNAGIITLGDLAMHTQNSMVRELHGIGWATAMSVARTFGRHRLSWKWLREALA